MSIEKQKSSQPEVVPFKTRNGFEMATTAPTVIPSLVEGLLIETGTSILSADPKCGKSTLARQLMVAVAEGREFLGCRTVCGDVLYLYLEGPEGVVQQHLHRLGHSGQRGKIEVISEHISSLSVALERLALNAKSLPNLRLVVIDPILKLVRVKDSHSQDDVTPAMEHIEKFAKAHRVHVMALAHDKKRKSEDRHANTAGSVSFRGATDTNVCLTKKGKERTISTEQRWGVDLEPTLLAFDELTLSSSLGKTVEDSDEERRSSKQRGTIERIERDIKAALTGKTLGTRELVDAITGKSATIIEVLEQMNDAGKIVEEQHGTSIRYKLAEIEIPIEITNEDKEKVAA